MLHKHFKLLFFKIIMGTVLWFTGLSGSGKTTIALALQKQLEAQGKSVALLDADVVRGTLHKNLGFSREDIRENNRLIAELAKEEATKNDYVLVPIISPYREDRAMVRSIIGKEFIELFVNSSLHECIKRDVKGLYKRALAGEINNFIGLAASNPYEPPLAPEMEVDTEKDNLKQGVSLITEYLRRKNFL